MVTRDDDPEFSNFVNAVVMSLFVAEQRNITKATASFSFPETFAFGDGHKDMFKHAVSAEGNYGELYTEYMAPFMPRQCVNRVILEQVH